MTRTAYDEHYGVGVDTAISANYVLRLPYGENGATYYVLRPSSAGLEVRLPIAAWARQWARYSIANHGSFSLAVKDTLGTTLHTLAVNERVTMTLIDAVTLPVQGTWVKAAKASAAGTTLVHDRVPLFVQFGTWAGTGINLRSYCNQVFGYDGSKPASVYCRLRNSIVIGSESPLAAQPSFDTGLWPAGTTLLLEITAGSKIVGMGGRGGAGGGGGIFAAPGQQGGTALVVQVDTGLVNYGTISGGGGGGGGGSAPLSGGGGGGGGGCGYQPSQGGLGGGTVAVGFPGAQGGIAVGGIGGNGTAGGFAGGFGGNPPGLTGASGFGGGGAGGAAGNAIVKLSTITLNKIVPGTILGPEITV